jgi:hypothetical protein
MKRIAPFLLPLLALAVLAPGVSGAGLPEGELAPYLIVAWQWSSPTNQPRPQTFYGDQSMVITQRGAVFTSRSSRSNSEIPQVQIYRGTATAAQMQEFRERLNAAKIRGLSSCAVTLPIEGWTSSTDVTWYSAHGRRNFFNVSGALAAGRPRCPDAVATVFQAINLLEGQILANPDTEILHFE